MDAVTKQVELMCGCLDPNCTRIVIMSLSDAYALQQAGYNVIVDGCTRGPRNDEVLVEHRKGYSLFALTEKV